MAGKDDDDRADAARLLALAHRAGGLTRAVESLLEDPDAAKPKAIFGVRDADRTVLATHVRLAVIESALDQPEKGAVSAANRLRGQGFNVAPSHVRGLWQHYKLSLPDRRRLAKVRSKELVDPSTPVEPPAQELPTASPTQHLLYMGLTFFWGFLSAAIGVRLWMLLR